VEPGDAFPARTFSQRERAAGLASGRVRFYYLTSACPRWCSLLAIAGQSESQAGEHLSHYDIVCAQRESEMEGGSPEPTGWVHNPAHLHRLSESIINDMPGEPRCFATCKGPVESTRPSNGGWAEQPLSRLRTQAACKGPTGSLRPIPGGGRSLCPVLPSSAVSQHSLTRPTVR
jgi:hypothetical protein